MEIDADLHLHSPHAGGVSDRMTVPVMAEQAGIKGLDLVGTGDCLNPDWRAHVREHTEQRDGYLEADGTRFLLTCEVEDRDRIHHLMLFPSFGAAEDVHDELARYSSDIDVEGRPRVDASGERIAQVCEKYGVLLGPAHAFTPWTAIYKEFDALDGCYGNSTDYLAFLELGLSADSRMADRISAHHDLSVVSFSDAHSPWPHRLGREFTRFRVQGYGFDEVRKALERKNGREPALNVGLDPREGKYHCTACISCYTRYGLEQARERDWTCQECGKRLKKGVKDRIAELADTGEEPDHRPDYVRVFPLPEIVRVVVGHASPTTKTVQRIYDDFQDAFPSEIHILTEAAIADLKQVHPDVARAVALFREEKMIMVPGGGGAYGELVIPGSETERKRILESRADELDCRYTADQQRIDDF